MAVDETSSAVERGGAQRGGNWPKPGDEGFVHPDGTPHSARQMLENQVAAADRKAAGSTIHGAPALGGVAPGIPAVEPSDLANAQAEHAEWVRKAHVTLAEEVAAEEAKPEGRHEAAVTPTQPRAPKVAE